jgi:hypothetical protein
VLTVFVVTGDGDEPSEILVDVEELGEIPTDHAYAVACALDERHEEVGRNQTVRRAIVEARRLDVQRPPWAASVST